MFRKGITLVVMLLFIGMSVVPSTGTTDVKQIVMPTSSGNTFYVDDDFNESTPGWNVTHFDKIKNALNVVNNGDTVFVFNGTYYENFKITKSINLIGEDRYSTIIDAQQKAHVINFKTNWINVSGFTLQNTRDWANDCGILIQDEWGTITKYNTVTDNIFINHRKMAITLYSTSYNTVSNNIIMDCNGGIGCGAIHRENIIANNTLIGKGISVWGRPQYDIVCENHITNGGGISVKGGFDNSVYDNVIEEAGNIKLYDTSENVVEHNTLISSGSILVDESIQNVIRHNTFIDSQGISINGNNLKFWNTHTIENNEINGKPICYYKNTNDGQVPSDASQVILANCNNFHIKDLNINSVSNGIQLGFSSFNNLSENIITNNYDNGITLQTSSCNIVSKNTITNNTKEGIRLKDGSSNKIRWNIISDNGEHGIQIDSGLFNKIHRNVIKNNDGGIYLFSSSYNLISGNNFIGNGAFHAFFKVEMFLQRNNIWIFNYWGNRTGFLPKPILGSIKTPFSYYAWDYGNVDIYRPGFNFDWRPALLPYNIGV